MAPPRKKNPSFPEKGFEKYNVTVTDPSTGKPRTYAEYRPKRGSGYDILTDDALISGNLKVLNDFRRTHRKELADPKNAPAKEYLDARIQTAKRFEARERNAMLDAAMKKTPPKLMVDNKDGFVGFSDLKYPDYQTSSNGCWSLAYSTLLMNRIDRNYRFVMGFNGSLIALGAFGVLQPATSALLHNGSTLLLSMDCLTPLLPQSTAALPAYKE